jgi:heat shock protein HslJ
MSDVDGPGPRAISDAVAGTRWRIQSIDGQPVGAAEPARVDFGHDGRVTGTTGVNNFTASYALSSSHLTIGPLATTRRAAGSEGLRRQEERVIGSLAGMCPVRLEPTRLVIDGPLGRVELVSVDPQPPSDPPAPPGHSSARRSE